MDNKFRTKLTNSNCRELFDLYFSFNLASRAKDLGNFCKEILSIDVIDCLSSNHNYSLLLFQSLIVLVQYTC